MENATSSGCVEIPCFFCLGNSRKHFYSSVCKSDSGGSLHVHEFSLRNLYRILNPVRCSDEQDKFLNELKIRTCEKCSRLMKKFNDLYNLLEETKLRLNWSVQKMEQVMSNSNANAENESTETIKEDVKLVEMLRTDAMNRMKAVIAFPRIVLNKNKRERLSSSVHQDDGRSSKMMKKEPEDLLTSLRLEPETIDREFIPSSQSPATLPLPHHHYSEMDEVEVAARNDSQNHLDSHSQDSPVNVQDESQEYTNAYITKKENIPRGKAIKKKIRDGPSSNPKTKGSPDYLSNFTRLLGLYPSSNKKVRCKLCKKTVDRRKAYIHWKSFHRNKSDSKGTQTIKNVKVIRKEDHAAVTDKNSDGFTAATPSEVKIEVTEFPSICPYCSFKYESASNETMMEHLVSYHPDLFILSENYNDNDTTHEIGRHGPMTIREILTVIVLPKFVMTSGRDTYTSCSICTMKFSTCDSLEKNIFMAKKHLLCMHRGKLKEYIRMALENPQQLMEELKEKVGESKEYLDEGVHHSETGGNKSLGLRSPIPPSAKTKNPFKTKYSSNCPYCPFKCTTRKRSSLNTHLIREHPEHFLVDYEKTPGPEVGLKTRRILTEIIFPEFISNSGPRTRGCSLCGMIFNESNHFMNNLVLAKKHVMFVHKKQVKEELGAIMHDSHKVIISGSEGYNIERENGHIRISRQPTSTLSHVQVLATTTSEEEME